MTTPHVQKMVGTVVSTKMKKTAVVEVVQLQQHPKFKKFIRTSKRYKAHNEKENVAKGDKVTIQSCRPLSREKRWIIVGDAL